MPQSSSGPAADSTEPTVCIAGGGPAGMMLGLLLARAGIHVLVLEKHGDFLRDFRGDTVHPSTLRIMRDLGLLDTFLQRPHQRAAELGLRISGQPLKVGDFRGLPDGCNFIAFMPQWHFLDFLAEQGRRYPTFRLEMNAEVTELLEEEDKVTGVRVTTPTGERTVRATLVVGADGRKSRVREQAGLKVHDFGAPIDVLWMRLSRQASDPGQVLGNIDRGRVFITLNRGDYWQCAFVIPKGSFEALKAQGIETLRRAITETVGLFADRVGELEDWDDVSLLTVRVDRLATWARAGLLCIGDAAHAMSPVGGVGINLAIQDAVAAANLLTGPLGRGTLGVDDLHRVQARRELPTRLTQKAQLFLHERVIFRVIRGQAQPRPPLLIRLLQIVPPLRRLLGRAVGLGVRPERVETGDAFARRPS